MIAIGIFSLSAGLAASVGVALATAVPAHAFDATMFDVAFGAAVTTDYISRGITQTNHDPAIQGYVEFDFGMLYAGVWASNVDFAGARDAEIDLSVGVRPELDPFAFDFGYVQYVYADDISPTYGELYALVDWSATDELTLGTDLYFAPDYSQLGGSAFYGEVNGEYALPANFSLSGGVGYQVFDGSLALADYVTWNAGLSWVWKETVTFDLRYSDTNLSRADCAALMAANACDARVVASLSVDTSWSALRGGN